MNLYDYLKNEYGYNEPIFSEDLNEKLNVNPNTLRQYIRRLYQSGKINKVRDGIYFIPNPNSVLKNPTLNVDKIINKKYLVKEKEIIGYESGVAFANRLNLTTQNPGVITIVTNEEKSAKRIVEFYKRKVALKKPRIQINNKNYKILQVLDLLNDFERLSVEPIEVANKKILRYLNGVMVSKKDLEEYLNVYPVKTRAKIQQTEVYDEITR